MLIQTLRRTVYVTSWIFNTERAVISYGKTGQEKLLHFIAAPTDILRCLSRNAIIDDFNEATCEVILDDKAYSWVSFATEYRLSQWDALCMAIDHEMDLSINEEANFLEMDEAIKSIQSK